MTFASFFLVAVTVVNAGFEESENGNHPTGWMGPNAYRTVPGEGRNGSAALRYDLGTKGVFLPQTAQVIKLEGGKTYRVSAWVKTKDVKIEKGERAAAVGIEWWDASGKCRGVYSRHVLGTEDWQELSVSTPRLCEDLARAHVQVYCGYGKTTGTAWFDDVRVEESVPPPVAELVIGTYRNVAAEGSVRFAGIINCPTKDLALYKAEFRYTGADGATHVASPVCPLTETEVHFELPVSSFKMGSQEVELALSERAGKVLGTVRRPFCRVARLPQRRVTFDRLNRTLVDGKPFFPLGMYCGVAEEKEMAVYCEGPFNCLMPYTEPTKKQLDLLRNHGLMVIYPLKEVFAGRDWAKSCGIITEQNEIDYITKRVNELKGHSAILAWYLNDELGVDMMDRLVSHQRLFESLDDQHPTWSCLYQVDLMRRFLQTYDVLGSDPYPVPREGLSLATDWTVLTRDAAFGLRPIWQIPQTFSWSWFKGSKPGDRMPTESEMRSMTWQMLAAGANGLICYAFHQMRKSAGNKFAEYWTSVKKVASEVKRFEPVFLAGDVPPTFARPADIRETKLPIRLFRDGPTVYVLAANATGGPVSADVCIQGSFNDVETIFGAAASLPRPDVLHVRIPAWGESLVRLELATGTGK